MAYPETLSQQAGANNFDERFATETETRLAQLDERISDLERSVTQVLKLLREILSLASVRRMRNDDH
jgi:hypothetical protein